MSRLALVQGLRARLTGKGDSTVDVPEELNQGSKKERSPQSRNG